MLNRIFAHWVYGGSLAGLLLIALMPLLTSGWPLELKVCYLTLPAYMLHQLEEWDDDRFRNFMNQHMGQGANVLTHRAGFVINVFGVWGVIAISLYLAATFNSGYALIAAYLVLVNAFVHIMAGLVLRSYNPGLITAIVLFLPLGGYLVQLVNTTGNGNLRFQITGLFIAIFIHIAIVLHLSMRKKQLIKSDPA